MCQKISPVWLSGLMRSGFNSFVSCIFFAGNQTMFLNSCETNVNFSKAVAVWKRLCTFESICFSLLKTKHMYCFRKGRILHPNNYVICITNQDQVMHIIWDMEKMHHFPITKITKREKVLTPRAAFVLLTQDEVADTQILVFSSCDDCHQRYFEWL